MKQPLRKKHDKVKELLEDGISQAKVAKTFGVSRQAVNEYMFQHFPDAIHKGVCLQCGGNLEHKRTGSRFCSNACYRRNCYTSRKVPHTCILCGKTTMKDRYTKAKYCGTKCAHVVITKLHTEEILERYTNGETIKEIAQSLKSTPRSIYAHLGGKKIRLTGRI